MMTPGHRATCCSRLLPGGAGWAVALAAFVLMGIAAVSAARAQDSWTPVVVANAPPLDPAGAQALPLPPSRPRPALRGTYSAPPLPAQWNGMPPLATVAAQTVGTPESRRAPAAAAPAPAPLPPEAMADADLRLAREYCLNIADPASDARIAWQKKVLAGIEQEIAKRLELLEAKTAEYQRWLARRDEFSKKAQESVVTIYARMRPDAAAAQLVAMDEETAAAVIARLDPRNASAILNEMDATQAARLTATIGGAANVNLPGKSRPQPGDKKS
jgi:flagellar motility protein MotE (MotC chaperone)